jgi:hypothetical protein
MAVSFRSSRRTLFALAVFSFVPLLTACPKKETPAVPDAAPPPPPPPEEASVLLPIEEDAGADADADAEVKKFTGTPVNTNVARLKQCCNQLRIQAKAMGASPEAGMLLSAAGQCDTMANAANPKANVPELGAIKTLLAGRNIPAVCAGF